MSLSDRLAVDGETRVGPAVEATLHHERLAEALRRERLGNLGSVAAAVGVQDEHLGALLHALQARDFQRGEVRLHVAREAAAELLARDGQDLAARDLDLPAAGISTDVHDDALAAGDQIVRLDGAGGTGVAAKDAAEDAEEHGGEQVDRGGTARDLRELRGRRGGEEAGDVVDGGKDGGRRGSDGAGGFAHDGNRGLNVDALRLDGGARGVGGAGCGAGDLGGGVGDDGSRGAAGVVGAGLDHGRRGGHRALGEWLDDGGHFVDDLADLLDALRDDAEGFLELIGRLVDAVEDGEEVLWLLLDGRLGVLGDEFRGWRSDASRVFDRGGKD